jgi:hypothetical protein
MTFENFVTQSFFNSHSQVEGPFLYRHIRGFELSEEKRMDIDIA